MGRRVEPRRFGNSGHAAPRLGPDARSDAIVKDSKRIKLRNRNSYRPLYVSVETFTGGRNGTWHFVVASGRADSSDHFARADMALTC